MRCRPRDCPPLCKTTIVYRLAIARSLALTFGCVLPAAPPHLCVARARRAPRQFVDRSRPNASQQEGPPFWLEDCAHSKQSKQQSAASVGRCARARPFNTSLSAAQSANTQRTMAGRLAVLALQAARSGVLAQASSAAPVRRERQRVFFLALLSPAPGVLARARSLQPRWRPPRLPSSARRAPRLGRARRVGRFGAGSPRSAHRRARSCAGDASATSGPRARSAAAEAADPPRERVFPRASVCKLDARCPAAWHVACCRSGHPLSPSPASRRLLQRRIRPLLESPLHAASASCARAVAPLAS